MIDDVARAALDALVRTPSVSADPGADLWPTAKLTASLFRDAGLPEVETIDDIPGGRAAGGMDQPAVRTVRTRRSAVRQGHRR
jgi:hypothetical protein